MKDTEAVKELKKLKRAVKKYCYECSGEIKTEAERCKIKDCPLWAYRK